MSLCIPFRYFYFMVYYNILMEKAMAPHSSTLSWKIPWTEAFPSSDIPFPMRCLHLRPSSFHPLVSLRPTLLQPVGKTLRAHR